MNIYAIGDLHLGTAVDKPMDFFGAHWENHTEKIIKNWENTVSEEDIVLIPGDISWAMRLEGAKPDLELIHELPGTKICIRGNHDYWWQKINYLNTLFDSVHFLQNTSYTVGKIGICGSRGWTCPNKRLFTCEDEKIYVREYERLRLSLDHAVKQKVSSIIVMLHYPPTNEEHEQSLFTELIKAYPVEHVVYGHLHDPKSHEQGLAGNSEGVIYHLASSDYLNFKPQLIV